MSAQKMSHKRNNKDLSLFEDVPLVDDFMHLVFTCMPGELTQATQVFAAALAGRPSSAN